jgi:hypothetical protein
MGIVRVERKPGLRTVRSRIRMPRIPVILPSRTALVVALAIGGAEAPEAWVRGLLLAGALIVSYLAGHRDGSRDHAIHLLAPGRDDRPAEPTTSGDA